jgi:polyferredoxin
MGFARAADNFLNTYVFGWSLRLLRQNFESLGRVAWIVTWVTLLVCALLIVSAVVRRCWCLNDCCTGVFLNIVLLLVLVGVITYTFGPLVLLRLILPWISMDIQE